MIRKTFRDDALQKEFEEKGYVLLPFLNGDEVDYLREQYTCLQHDLGKGFHASMHSKNIDYRRKVNQIISAIFTPKAQQILLNYRPLVANYTVKEPGQASFFDFHLDWNMVDETLYRSITIWCPLTDTNAENGNLWILEASHTLGNSYRCGPGLELFFEHPDELQKMKYEKKALPMKAGQAIIYDHKLFHGSPPNMSRDIRIAINQAMCPAEAPAMHYASVDNGDIQAFEVDDDFFCRVIIDKLELNQPVRRFPRPHQKAKQQAEVNQLIQ